VYFRGTDQYPGVSWPVPPISSPEKYVVSKSSSAPRERRRSFPAHPAGTSRILRNHTAPSIARPAFSHCWGRSIRPQPVEPASSFAQPFAKPSFAVSCA
jgi:hypothetical protein